MTADKNSRCELQRAKIRVSGLSFAIGPARDWPSQERGTTARLGSYDCLIERKPVNTADSGEDDLGLGKPREGLTDEVSGNRGYKQS